MFQNHNIVQWVSDICLAITFNYNASSYKQHTGDRAVPPSAGAHWRPTSIVDILRQSESQRNPSLSDASLHCPECYPSASYQCVTCLQTAMTWSEEPEKAFLVFLQAAVQVANDPAAILLLLVYHTQ